MRHLYESIQAALARGETVAYLKVVGVQGSAPQVVGASLLLREDGSFEGTIGGGAIEAKAIERARELLAKRRTEMLEFRLSAELGMCCGGDMTVFCEILEPSRRLLLYGGGHVAQPTAALAAQLGFELWVVDERPEWANAERFPDASRLVNLPVDEAFEEIQARDRDFVVVVTRGHEQDQEVLEHYLRHAPFYLGVIGSKSKIARAVSRCRAKGIKDEQLERVCMPIGLDIGACTPDEIAVSIVAELVAHLRGRGERMRAASMSAGNALRRASTLENSNDELPSDAPQLP